jgi:hypothetical protein
VGTQDAALYRFEDDGSANNTVAAGELTALALFLGLRSETLNAELLGQVFDKAWFSGVWRARAQPTKLPSAPATCKMMSFMLTSPTSSTARA